VESCFSGDRRAPPISSALATERAKPELVDAHDLIRKILRGFEVRVREKNLKVALELNARQRTVTVDGSARETLDQSVASLIESALGVTSDDALLIVRTRSRDDGASGLRIESMRGGSVFILELEGSSRPPAEGSPPSATRLPPSASGLRVARAPKLLVVDDDVDTVVLMRRALERRGFVVITATCVAEGLDAFAANVIDVVISDLGLPDGSGIELVQALSKDGTVRAIALTGSGGPDDVARALSAGFADHLTKPVEIATLEQAINKLLGQHGLAQATPSPNDRADRNHR
jgi:CheY-like chemotaxis protein